MHDSLNELFKKLKNYKIHIPLGLCVFKLKPTKSPHLHSALQQGSCSSSPPFLAFELFQGLQPPLPCPGPAHSRNPLSADSLHQGRGRGPGSPKVSLLLHLMAVREGVGETLPRSEALTLSPDSEMQRRNYKPLK